MAPSTPARAQEQDWTLEYARFRFAVFEQEGRGVQSQWRTQGELPNLRGSEHAWIFQPVAGFRLRQDRNAVHNVAIPIDIVTAASTDGLDAVTSESRENEAATIDVVSSVRTSEHTTVHIHWGGHLEEPFGSGFLGATVETSLAEDNATLRLGVETIHDTFDPIQYNGNDPGLSHRQTWSVNGSLSQLLSPTTIVGGSYTFTGQIGVLETTYNSVPTESGGRLGDYFGNTRGRHTFTFNLRHGVEETRTFFWLDYRFYADSFDAVANTAQLTLTQYLGPVWIRAHYRFHHQFAPSFWTSVVPDDFPRWMPRTGDSDLESFLAHEVGASIRWFFDPHGALTASSSFAQLSYIYYARSNSLESHVGAFDFGLSY
ncbi:MAG: DUF3570 domain-containing protein [Sandaracinaceae bacterium]